MGEGQQAAECGGGGATPVRTAALPSTGNVGVCPVCGDTVLLDEEGLLPRHYAPGAAGGGQESIAPDA